jgi:hypothetical protein
MIESFSAFRSREPFYICIVKANIDMDPAQVREYLSLEEILPVVCPGQHFLPTDIATIRGVWKPLAKVEANCVEVLRMMTYPTGRKSLHKPEALLRDRAMAVAIQAVQAWIEEIANRDADQLQELATSTQRLELHQLFVQQVADQLGQLAIGLPEDLDENPENPEEVPT